jgi:hypothetical protein
MKNLKKRMAILLTLIMIVPSIITCLPTATITSQAADNTIYSIHWTSEMTTNSKGTGNLVMQVGQSVKIGGLITLLGTGSYTTALNYSGKFYSSNSKVASFDKNGTLTAKKSGKIKITCNYEGNKLRCNITVLKKGSIKEVNNSDIKKFTKNVNSLNKIVAKGINDKNCYTIYNKWISLSNQWSKLKDSYFKKDKSFGDGLLKAYKSGGNSSISSYTSKLVVPAYCTYEDIKEKLNIFLWDMPGTTTNMGLEFKSTKMTVKNTKSSTIITVKLANKLTKRDLFNAWVANRWDEKFDTPKALTVFVTLSRNSGYQMVGGFATMKLGSDEIIVETYYKLDKGTYRFYDKGYPTKFITGAFKVK